MLDKNQISARIFAGLLGQAVADSIGYEFEFQYKKKFTPSQIIKLANESKILNISDDTQMALFSAIAAYDWVHSSKNITECVTQQYIDWYITQSEEYNSQSSDLLSFKELYVRRAPGNTCLSACHSLQNNQPVCNDSRGCGSVMRLLPFVSLGFDANFAAVISASVTHCHEENQYAAAKLMKIYDTVLDKKIDSIEFKSGKTIEDHGQGWTAMSCVDMAYWSYLNSDTFDQLLVNSIWHDGDSDSVAAIAGSIWGLSGKPIPQKYIDKIAEIDSITYTKNLIEATVKESNF